MHSTGLSGEFLDLLELVPVVSDAVDQESKDE